MALPEWTGRQSLAQPNINPTAAIEGASRAFGGISDYLQRQELAKQAEAYRQQQLASQQAHQQAQLSLQKDGMGLQREGMDIQRDGQKISADQFNRSLGLQKEQFDFNKGAMARATQARMEEENRQRAQAAERYQLFNSKVNELDNQQLANFNPGTETIDAMRRANMSEDQIAAVIASEKSKNSDLFVDKNKSLSGAMDFLASTGRDPAEFSGLVDLYKSRNGMGSVDKGAVDFAQKLALENIKAGKSGSGSGGSSGVSAAGFAAIDNEKLFKDGSDAIYKEILPGQRTKVYKEDVRRIAEHALINRGIDPKYVVEAIKADMDDGQTNYTLSKMNTDENDKGYQGILASAELMQNRSKKTSGATSPQGDFGSAEFALSLSRGYQPVNQEERKNLLLDQASQRFPDLFGKQQGTASAAEEKSLANPKTVKDQEKLGTILSMAKELANQTNVVPGQMVMGPYGQVAPAVAPKNSQQKELSRLLSVMEKTPKANVEMPDTPEYRLFPERWKNPNTSIDANNAKLEVEQQKAVQEMLKILRNGDNPENSLSPLAKWAKDASVNNKS